MFLAMTMFANWMGENMNPTLFAEDTPASPLVRPGSDEARKMTATSGQRCLPLSKEQGPLGLLERTLLGTSAWASTTCFLTWRAKATPAGRLLFQLAPQVPPTAATEFGLWQTPVADDAVNRARGKFNSRGEPKLSAQAKMWPTPLARDCKGPAMSRARIQAGRKPDNLPSAVKHYATPQARDYRTGQAERWNNPNRSRNLNDQMGGKLSVIFVEYLMGFPEGWTDLEPSETPSSPKSLK